MTGQEETPSDDQLRMAHMMGLNPNDPKSWPDELDYLVWFKNNFFEFDFDIEFRRKWSNKFRPNG